MDRKRLCIAVPLLLPLSSSSFHCKSTSATDPKEAAQQIFLSCIKYSCLEIQKHTSLEHVSNSINTLDRPQSQLNPVKSLWSPWCSALPSSGFNADVPLLGFDSSLQHDGGYYSGLLTKEVIQKVVILTTCGIQSQTNLR